MHNASRSFGAMRKRGYDGCYSPHAIDRLLGDLFIELHTPGLIRNLNLPKVGNFQGPGFEEVSNDVDTEQ